MKEHHVPMLLRQADENIFHVMMRIRGFVFLTFMTLSGCLSHLTNYFPDTCLHTQLDATLIDAMDVTMTDYYQYCMVALIWFISIPVLFFLVMSFFRDATRYAMIPCMVTSVVFGLFALCLSMLSIFNMFLNGHGTLVKTAHGVNVLVYLYLQLFNGIYRYKYAKRDLLRTEEEEIDV